MVCSDSGDSQVGRVAAWCRPAQLQRGRLRQRRGRRRRKPGAAAAAAAARLPARLGPGAAAPSRRRRGRGGPVLRPRGPRAEPAPASPRLPVPSVRPGGRRHGVPAFAGAHAHECSEKLSYRRGTARCVRSVEILPVATQQCRNWSYDKSLTKYQLSLIDPCDKIVL